jgi:hypothetical protein
MKTQLLCTFTPANKLRFTIDNIVENYTIVYDKVFVLSNLDNHREYMCTYNVYKDGLNGLMDYTISLHRKKETNTLYTINALNELIKLINNGILDTSYQIDWNNYNNTMLTTNDEGLKKIPTKIKEVVYIKTKV